MNGVSSVSICFSIVFVGLTSPGGKMEDVGVDRVVAIHAEGKTHALAVGLTKMSTSDMYD
jgi:malignant T-cell-amplified sequence